MSRFLYSRPSTHRPYYITNLLYYATMAHLQRQPLPYQNTQPHLTNEQLTARSTGSAVASAASVLASPFMGAGFVMAGTAAWSASQYNSIAQARTVEHHKIDKLLQHLELAKRLQNLSEIHRTLWWIEDSLRHLNRKDIEGSWRVYMDEVAQFRLQARQHGLTREDGLVGIAIPQPYEQRPSLASNMHVPPLNL